MNFVISISTDVEGDVSLFFLMEISEYRSLIHFLSTAGIARKQNHERLLKVYTNSSRSI